MTSAGTDLKAFMLVEMQVKQGPDLNVPAVDYREGGIFWISKDN